MSNEKGKISNFRKSYVVYQITQILTMSTLSMSTMTKIPNMTDYEYFIRGYHESSGLVISFYEKEWLG